MKSPLIVGRWYPCALVDVIDGDTLNVVVTLDSGDHYPTNIRLAGINAPELHGVLAAAGSTAKLTLASLVAGCTLQVLNQVDHLDKYGRVIGWVQAVPPIPAAVYVSVPAGFGPLVTPATASTRNLSALMLAAGQAVPFMAAESGADPSLV